LSQSSICAVESTWSSCIAVREHRQLVEVFGEPSRLLGQVGKAVLDHRRLRAHAHDLVRLRLVAGDRVEALLDQLLDQLRPEGLVFDQHDVRIEGFALLVTTWRLVILRRRPFPVIVTGSLSVSFSSTGF
jgi:hypothetical protein